MMALCGSVGCGDAVVGAPGIPLGALEPSFSAVSLTSGSQSFCEDYCDGDLGDIGIATAGDPDNDAGALFGLILMDAVARLSENDVFAAAGFADTRSNLDAEPVRLSFNITRTTNCNSTGIAMHERGDASAGTIVERLLFSAMFNQAGIVEESDSDSLYSVGFHNCTITGDLLGQAAPGMAAGEGGGAAVMLGGGWAERIHDSNPGISLAPDTRAIAGRVFLRTDRNGDGVFNDPFWTHVVDINVEGSRGGFHALANGGACAGERVVLGPGDPEIELDGDDHCAPDTDGKSDAWRRASYILY